MDVGVGLIAPALFLWFFVSNGTETNAVTESVMTDEEWTELQEIDTSDQNKKYQIQSLANLNKKANKSQVEIPERKKNKNGEIVGVHFKNETKDEEGNARGIIDDVHVWAISDKEGGLTPVPRRGT